MKRLKNITVVYNLPETDLVADWDTVETAKTITNILTEASYEVEDLGIRKNQISVLGEVKTDLVFNLLEWGSKDWVYVIKALKLMENKGMCYTGSDSTGSRIGADKVLMKSIMSRRGIPTPKWQVFENAEGKMEPIPYPAIVKPVYEHCSIGVDQKSIVNNKTELRDRVGQMVEKYGQPVLVEEYIEGRELHVTVFEKRGRPWVLPAAEVVFEKAEGFVPVLSYSGKWQKETSEYSLSTARLAQLDDRLTERLKRIAQRCYRQLRGRDYTRLDVRIRGEQIWVLEMNHNPGLDFYEDGDVGVAARAAGFESYAQVVKYLAENAYRRWVERRWRDTAVV